MTDTLKPLYGEGHAGCWLDNCRGVYMGEAIISEAITHGFKYEMDGPLCRYSDREDYMHLWHEADTFMDQFAAPGFWFGSNDNGDWGLWPCEDNEPA